MLDESKSDRILHLHLHYLLTLSSPAICEFQISSLFCLKSEFFQVWCPYVSLILSITENQECQTWHHHNIISEWLVDDAISCRDLRGFLILLLLEWPRIRQREEAIRFFDLRIWILKRDGCGEVVPMQLRREFSVGGELLAHGVRAPSWASRRWPRWSSYSSQRVLRWFLSVPSRSDFAIQFSPRFVNIRRLPFWLFCFWILVPIGFTDSETCHYWVLN